MGTPNVYIRPYILQLLYSFIFIMNYIKLLHITYNVYFYNRNGKTWAFRQSRESLHMVIHHGSNHTWHNTLCHTLLF